MWFLRKKAKSLQLSGFIPPLDGAEIANHISLPTKDIPTYVERYVAAMETQRTDDWCWCEWVIHPDDIDLPKGKRRRIRSDTAPDCPVHTKEGFLSYFFDWVMNNEGN